MDTSRLLAEASIQDDQLSRDIRELVKENTSLKQRVEELVIHNQSLIQAIEDWKVRLSEIEASLRAECDHSAFLEKKREEVEVSFVKLRKAVKRFLDYKKMILNYTKQDEQLHQVLDEITPLYTIK